MNFLTIICIFLLLFFTLPGASDDIDDALFYMRDSAKVRILDKITTKSVILDISVGTTEQFGNLLLQANSCTTSAEFEKKSDAALLKIFEIKENKMSKLLFNQWIFSDNLAISYFQHPIYDVTLVECYNRRSAAKL